MDAGRGSRLRGQFARRSYGHCCGPSAKGTATAQRQRNSRKAGILAILSKGPRSDSSSRKICAPFGKRPCPLCSRLRASWAEALLACIPAFKNGRVNRRSRPCYPRHRSFRAICTCADRSLPTLQQRRFQNRLHPTPGISVLSTRSGTRTVTPSPEYSAPSCLNCDRFLQQ